MNIKVNILGLIAILTLFSSCIKDGETLCPEGKVTFLFFAEKFQNKSQNPLDDREEKFCDRIQQVRYYLYKDNNLKEERVIDKFDSNNSNCFTLEYTDLEPGNYRMVVIGNSTKTALSGDPANAANLVLTYPGTMETEDYFTTVFPFTVHAEEVKTYEVGLSRAHGVIRYKFVNMPADVSGIGVMMDNVTAKKWITGDYAEVYEASRRFNINRTETRQSGNDEIQDYVIGTFPTTVNERSAFYLSLYRDGVDTPYLNRMISDTLVVTRNQLIEIVTTFNDGNVDFEIYLDNEWDGSLHGGIGEVTK